VGRLVQTRLTSLNDPLDMCQVQAALHSVLASVAERAVICTDWTKLDVLSPEIAKSVYEMLAVTNTKVLRGAILLHPEKATFNLQIERIIREAGNSSRRCFRRESKLLDWIAEVLTPEELSCVREFLSEQNVNCIRAAIR
jgi:hypothetical protein